MNELKSYFHPPKFSAAWWSRGVIFAARRIRFLASKLSFGAITPFPWDYPDNIYTPHNLSFFLDPVFQKGYQAAKQAGTFDYRIPFRVHQALWAAKSASVLNGSFVELGTGKGFVMAAVIAALPETQTKDIFLFDLFEKPELSGAGIVKYSKYYSSGFEVVSNTFKDYPKVQLIKGDVLKTLPLNCPEKIAFLHVDLNNAEIEFQSLSIVWDHLVNGAIIIFDDYANRGLENQYQAVNSFISEKLHSVLTTPSGQGIVIKRNIPA